MTKTSFAALTICFLFHISVFAQSDTGLVGTLKVSAIEQFSGGEFKGCSLNFQVATTDHMYRNGNLVVVDGSYNLNLVRKSNATTAGILLKVGVLEMGKPKPEAPLFAYFKTNKASTAKSVVSTGGSDNSGYQIFVLKLDSQVMTVFTEMLDLGEVEVGFNRKDGGRDVVAKIDLRVVESKPSARGLERIRNDSTLVKWSDCVLKGLEAVR